MTFDDTVGTATSTSYCSVAAADAYHAAQPPGTRTFIAGPGEMATWADLPEASKQHRLMLATRLLDSIIEWTGERFRGHPDSVAGRTEGQRLEWPRYEMYDRTGKWLLERDAIPEALQHATAEYAGQLGEASRTVDDAVETASLTTLRAGPVNLAFDRPQAKPIPDAVVYLLYPNWIRRIRQRSRNTIGTASLAR